MSPATESSRQMGVTIRTQIEPQSRVCRVNDSQAISSRQQAVGTGAINPASGPIINSAYHQQNGESADLYTQVNKRRTRKKKLKNAQPNVLSVTNNDSSNVPAAVSDGALQESNEINSIVKRSQSYDYSLLKQQQIPIVAVPNSEGQVSKTSPPINRNYSASPTSYYDTVYEDADSRSDSKIKLSNGTHLNGLADK